MSLEELRRLLKRIVEVVCENEMKIWAVIYKGEPNLIVSHFIGTKEKERALKNWIDEIFDELKVEVYRK